MSCLFTFGTSSEISPSADVRGRTDNNALTFPPSCYQSATETTACACTCTSSLNGNIFIRKFLLPSLRLRRPRWFMIALGQSFSGRLVRMRYWENYLLGVRFMVPQPEVHAAR